MLVSVFGFVLMALVFLTRSYRLLNQAYDAGDVNADLTAEPGAADPIPGPNVLGKGHAES